MKAQRMNESSKKSGMKKANTGLSEYQSEHMQKDMVIKKLREQGFRITKQRKLLIDIILGEICSCCKEVYILASKQDPGIGMATVYRTVDALEQVGALKRRMPYQLCKQGKKAYKRCLVELEDSSMIELDYYSMEKVIENGMHHCGFSKGKRIKGITLVQDD